MRSRLSGVAAVVAMLTTACGHAPDRAASATGVPANGPLWSASQGGIVPASGNVDPAVLCQGMLISLRLDPTAPEPPGPSFAGAPAPCPKISLYLGYLRGTLFVEGLDRKGARLFVATGDNPLHQDVEAPPPPAGGTMSWQAVETPAPVVGTFLRLPVSPALVRLRWYDVDANFQPHLLGEMAWAAAAP